MKSTRKEGGGTITYDNGIGKTCHGAFDRMGWRGEWVLNKVGIPFPTTIDSETIASIQHQVRLAAQVVARVILPIAKQENNNTSVRKITTLVIHLRYRN